jgi:hypothetical protein
VIERFRRRTARAMDVEITIDDSKDYTRPWKVTVRFEQARNADLGEQACAVKPADDSKN